MKPSALAFAALLAVAASAGASLGPLGPPVELATSQPCLQNRPQIANLAGGDYIAVWTGDVEGGYGLVARRLDANGRPLGEEIALDDRFDPRDPVVAALDDGGFVVAWWEELVTRVLLRAFDADGRPRSDTIYVANYGLPSPSPGGVALAIGGDGGPVVSWSDGNRIWLRVFAADLSPRSDWILVAERLPFGGLGRVALAASSLPFTLVVWEETSPTNIGPPPFRFTRLRGRIASPDGGLSNPAFTITDGEVLGPDSSLAPAAAALSGGAFAVAWAGTIAGAGEAGVFAQILEPSSGFPLGARIRVSEGRLSTAGDTDLVARPRGGFAVAWRRTLFAPPVDPLPGEYLRQRVLARQFDIDGAPLGGEFALSPRDPDPDRPESQPTLASAAGRLVAVWRESTRIPDGPIPPVLCFESPLILARTFAESCEPTDRRLCLQGGRFAVEVRLPDPLVLAPLDRRATAVPVTADAGTFWFFYPENVELLVKVLDGRPVNGYFWVFAGALSNVHYAIDVTDTLTGERRSYDNPQGRLASLADTAAFKDSSPPSPALAATDEDRHRPGSPPDHTHPIPTCDAADVLCLRGGRFLARVSWRDPRSGDGGAGRAANLTDQSGTFWFFDPANAEVVLKVLDGRAVNGYFWVFVGGLTDVEFTLTVEDVENHTSWFFHNPPFTLNSHADVAALPGSVDSP